MVKTDKIKKLYNTKENIQTVQVVVGGQIINIDIKKSIPIDDIQATLNLLIFEDEQQKSLMEFEVYLFLTIVAMFTNIEIVKWDIETYELLNNIDIMSYIDKVTTQHKRIKNLMYHAFVLNNKDYRVKTEINDIISDINKNLENPEILKKMYESFLPQIVNSETVNSEN